jgi:transcriptional regulator with XRE-family HTH domain
VRRPSLELGEIIRRQRELNRLSLRQFAAMAGISNPYLSQIERGLRAPSEEVVDAIARSLETSASELYERAGISDDNEGEKARAQLESLLAADQALAPRQRRALLEMYDAFVAAGPVATGSRPRRRPRTESGD